MESGGGLLTEEDGWLDRAVGGAVGKTAGWDPEAGSWKGGNRQT